MQKLTIWHNPRCSKSREALKLIEEKGLETEVFKYLEEQPSKEEIVKILDMLGIKPKELMRTKEALYKELVLKNENDDEKLIEAMAEHPKLIERPIVIKDSKAVIGRPPSAIVELLQ